MGREVKITLKSHIPEDEIEASVKCFLLNIIFENLGIEFLNVVSSVSHTFTHLVFNFALNRRAYRNQASVIVTR